MELQRLVMEDALETPLSEDMSPQEVCGRSRQGSVCVNPAEEVRSLSGRSLASEDSDASSVVYHKSLRGVAAGVGGDGVDRDGSESSEKDVGESGEKVTDEKGGVKDIESGEKVTDEKGGEKVIESGEKVTDEKGGEKDIESGEKDIDEKGGVKDIESGEKVTDKNVGEKDIGENDKENTNEKNTNPTDNNDKDKYTDNNNNSDNNPTTSMEPKEEDIQTKSSPPHDETPAIPIDFTEDFTTLFHSRSSQSLQTKPAEINPAEKNSTETKTEIGDEKKAVSMSARILGVLGRKTEEDKKKKQKKKREGEEIAQEAKEEASVEETQEMDGGGKKKWEIDQRKSGEIVRSRCDGSDEADVEFAEAGKQQESSCWEGGGSY